MKTPQGPKVIEFNCRFGDPETEVVLPRLDTDIYDIFSAVADHTPMPAIEWKKEVTMGFVMASKGYPGSYDKGYEIDLSSVISSASSVISSEFHTVISSDSSLCHFERPQEVEKSKSCKYNKYPRPRP